MSCHRVLRRDLPYRSKWGNDCRVVDQEIHGPGVVFDLGDHLLHRFGVGDVDGERGCVPASLVDEPGSLVNLVRAARGHRDVGPLAGQPECDPRPSPRPAPVTTATRPASRSSLEWSLILGLPRCQPRLIRPPRGSRDLPLRHEAIPVADPRGSGGGVSLGKSRPVSISWAIELVGPRRGRPAPQDSVNPGKVVHLPGCPCLARTNENDVRH